jgi:hypothetical protein
MAMLESFLQINVRKPFMAQVDNITGYVTLSAVIEPTGQPTGIKVIDGLRADCDQEAIRAFSLFRAWKPAIKLGKPVRQMIQQKILFGETEPAYFEDGNRLTFYDASKRIINNLRNAKYVLYEPIDTLSLLPVGDATYYKIRRKKELEPISTLPFTKLVESINSKTKDTVFRVGYKPENGEWFGAIHMVGSDGKILANYSSNRVKTGFYKLYTKHGMVLFLYDHATDIGYNWHRNGLASSILEKVPDNRKKRNGLYDYKMMSAWDTTGKEMVKNGSGYYRAAEDSVSSLRDTTKTTLLIEEGYFKNGLKDGVWHGYYADSSFSYEERFENEESFEGKGVH